ncbi:MAG: hypothetical protein M3Y28_02480 [Armatimonadota bacterium]|nr:hypothetical protein [Armatimonadota bacterium]
MKYFLLLIVPLLLSATPALQIASHADATADVRKAIQAVYAKQDAAAAHKDISGMMNTLAKDYNATERNGRTITHLESQQAMTKIFPVLKQISAHTVIEWIDVRDTQATVVTRSRTTTVVDGTLMRDKQIVADTPIVADAIARALWVKTNAGWKIRRLHVLSSITTIIGKQILPLRGGVLLRPKCFGSASDIRQKHKQKNA